MPKSCPIKNEVAAIQPKAIQSLVAEHIEEVGQGLL